MRRNIHTSFSLPFISIVSRGDAALKLLNDFISSRDGDYMVQSKISFRTFDPQSELTPLPIRTGHEEEKKEMIRTITRTILHADILYRPIINDQYAALKPGSTKYGLGVEGEAKGRGEGSSVVGG